MLATMSPSKSLSKAERARLRAGSQRRRTRLGVDAIVDVALRIVDTEGVDEVSMRRVAAEFDTGPASLYAHVANKEELLKLVLERVIEEIAVPGTVDELGSWQEVVRRWAHNSREVMLRHNDLARLSFAHVPSGPRMLEMIERLLEAMLGGGVPPRVATWALDVISLYLTADAYEGYLMKRVFDDGSGRPPEEVGQEQFARLGEYFASLPADRYPRLVANVETMMTGSGDDRFAFGVDMIIAGVAAQAATR